MSYLKSLSRRDLLKTGAAAGSLLFIGGGFVAAPNAAAIAEIAKVSFFIIIIPFLIISLVFSFN